MNKLSLAFVSAVLLIGINTLQSQSVKDSSKVYYYKGRVVNNQNKPLVFAHVINIRRGHATITDSTGNFKLPVVYKDSLRVSSIGYRTRYLIIGDNS